MFRDRVDAGEQLAKKLIHYKGNKDAIAIGLPRGGVPVAYEVSRMLGLPLDIVCPRKIGAPGNPEFAIGAITETGEGMFDTQTIARLRVSNSYIEKEVQKEKQVALARLKAYREGLPPRVLEGKTVILIDDGLATGATMKAAIRSARSQGVLKIVVAIPVSPPSTLDEMEELADEVVCLDAPLYFQAVGQFYEDFSPTEDEEVVALMHLSNQE